MSVLERVYFLHGELTRNRFPNARSLMREFEISLPTARRDIAYLRDRLLAPLAYDARKNGFFYTDDDFNLPFENSPRIIFLLGMLNRLAEETGLSGLPEIRQLEKRLSTVVAQDYQHIISSIHCEWVEVEHPSPVIFDTIIEAIVKNRQLQLTYRTPQKEETSRTVEPRKLINYQGRWYLAAWCTLRQDTRMFHLARIQEAQPGDKAQLAPDQPFDVLDKSFGIFKGEPLYEAQIRFNGTAAELVKNQLWHKDQVLEETGDGVILSLPVSDDREIMMKVLQYGSQALVLGPEHLREKVEQEIRSMHTGYDTG
jgi:predicted DNA-binding transcriptional regulator YafY